MFIQNCWYVAAWSHEVVEAAPLARTIIDQPLVLYRNVGGNVVALLDRCAHRGAPLSLGRIEGDNIRCLYHGLCFDPSGRCVDIPSQAKIPDRAQVRAFPAVEAHRWIWIWMGDPERADHALIPPTPNLDDPDWRCKPDYIHYSANYLLIADNLLDFSHLPFLHPSSLGGSPDYAEVLPAVERLERGVRLTKWVRDTEPPAYSSRFGKLGLNGKVDRWMFYDFLAPGVLLMDTGMQPAGVNRAEEDRSDSIGFRGYQALTPETGTSTHYFFAHCHNFGIDDSSVTDAIHDGILVAFAEDKEMISAQARNLDLDPDYRMMPLAVDAGLQQFRSIIDRLLKAEAAT